MPRFSKDNAAAKEARKARREAKKAARANTEKPGSLPFPGSSHIKRNTQGTSNEISFSVLHALKNSSVSGSKKAHGVPSTPRTMAEVAAEKARDEAHASLGITSSAEEASRRSSQRVQQRTKRIGLLVASCALAACAVVAVVMVSMQLGEERQNQLTPAVGLIEQADGTLFAFDGIVVNAMSSSLPEMIEQETALRYDACLPTLATAEAQMEQARTIIQQAQPELTEEADIAAAAQMLDTLDARKELITTGEAAMNATMTVLDLYECVDDGWNGLLNADALARDAAALSGYATLATLQAALDKTDETIDAFAAVRTLFTQARADIAQQRSYQTGEPVVVPSEQTESPSATENGGEDPTNPDAAPASDASSSGNEQNAPNASAEPSTGQGDPEAISLLDSLDDILAHYLEYIELRIEAQYEAKRSTQAIIDHDSALAQEANNAYNQLDSRAVSFIRGTVEPPTDYVTKLFEREREELFSPYTQARTRASESDAYLGDYLATLGR